MDVNKKLQIKVKSCEFKTVIKLTDLQRYLLWSHTYIERISTSVLCHKICLSSNCISSYLPPSLESMHISRSPIIPIAEEIFYSITVSAGSSYQQPLDGLMSLFINIVLNNSQSLLCGMIRQPLYNELIQISKKCFMERAHGRD